MKFGFNPQHYKPRHDHPPNPKPKNLKSNKPRQRATKGSTGGTALWLGNNPLRKPGGRKYDSLANLVVQWYMSVHWATEIGWGSAPWQQQSAAQRAALVGAAHSLALMPLAPHPRQ